MPTHLPAPPEARFTTVADGVRAQVIERALLPAHLTSAAHEGRMAGCRCQPLLHQLVTIQQRAVVPRGSSAACAAEEHRLELLRTAAWPTAPAALRLQARGARVELMLTMCSDCGAVEVRDVSYHSPAGLRLSSLAPRRRSDVLGWYAGARPGGRVYL